MTYTIIRQADIQSRARPAGYDPERLDGVALVVGLGAAGQNTAQSLALSGVRELRVVDADRFEEHNATRSPGFPVRGSDSPDIAKAPTVAGWLKERATHPAARVRWADAWIEDLGTAAFEDVDVVVCCVDSLRARAYLSDRCGELGLPMVEVGFGGPDVTVGVYPAATDQLEASATPCWRCGREIHDEVVSCRTAAAAAEQAGVVPAIQTAAAVAGGLQAEAVIEVLHDHAVEARRVWLNIRTGEAAAATLVTDPVCAGPHRLLPDPIATTADVDAPLASVLQLAGASLSDDAALVLPSPYIERGACASCAATIDVRGPGHRYARAPFCDRCRGTFARSPSGALPDSPVAIVRRYDPLARLSARAVGIVPGQRVVVRNSVAEVVLRVAGDPDGLFVDA